MFVLFQNGNYFNEEYRDLLFVNIPLVLVTVKNEPGTSKLYLDPPPDHVREFIRRCFSKIVKVNTDMPRVESVLFPGKRITILIR
jgi:hypothetical protein